MLSVVGQELFSLLFVDGLRGEVAQALNKLKEGQLDLLRIKLWFSGSHEEWLASLPWEYVRTPAGDTQFDGRGVFLSQHAELVLSRRVQSPSLRRFGQDQRPLTVLLVSPNPGKPEIGPDGEPVPGQMDPVDPGRVVDKLQELEAKGLIKLQQLVDDPPGFPDPDYEWVTRRRLRERMRQDPKPVVIHFVGHGRSREGHGELLFAKEDGSADWVDDETFAGIVGKSQTVKLAFLQACETASAGAPDPYVSFSGVARQLAALGLPAVIAMQYRIKAELATAFADAFYDALITDNKPVDMAVEAGRQAIEDVHDDRDRLAFGLPVVYLTADHEGIAAGGALRGSAVSRGDVPQPKPCVRCETLLEASDNGCRTCGLKLRCVNPACTKQPLFRDPLQDQYCSECMAPANQPPWGADRISALGEAVFTSSADVAGGVLSVLRPGT